MIAADRLGRYELVGRLATGGMAEVLLARVVGPEGFVRAVVVKRILDHLAAREDFRAMFLDEARIVSRIHHDNVVQVHELGEDDGQLYLVMEYLQGESAAGLMRRLVTAGEKLPPALAAHIVAEAATGLHAAHELVDEQGEPLGLVHRDASPQNLFITYDGAVKVLDF
ncbi:MAG: serine/threonine protein kinase, partial [Myxococcales bacterium]|nr:serine/threonine protein kinase [Myxococcales bacterium]